MSASVQYARQGTVVAVEEAGSGNHVLTRRPGPANANAYGRAACL
jgi:hypothetical protein